MAESDSPRSVDARDLIALVRSPDATRELRAFAARGLLPLESDDRLRALLAVVSDPDPDIGLPAAATLGEVPPDDLARFLDNADPTESELDVISRHSDDHFVLERVIRNRAAGDDTLLRLASIVSGAPQEALIINQVRLLRHPALIGALLENPDLTVDGRRRLLEMREEFFDKEDRRRELERLRREEEERRARQEAAGIVFDEPEQEVAEEGEGADSGEAGAPSGEEVDEGALAAIFRRISMMTVKEKLGLAQRGTKEERRILIGDVNKIVSLAVLRCEALTLAEIESFCAMRHLHTELFHEIASAREWIKRPRIQIALVHNPAVPISITLPLVKFLGLRELRNLARDRNLPEGIRMGARKVLFEKRG